MADLQPKPVLTLKVGDQVFALEDFEFNAHREDVVVRDPTRPFEATIEGSFESPLSDEEFRAVFGGLDRDFGAEVLRHRVSGAVANVVGHSLRYLSWVSRAKNGGE